jgi:hypothetical protein
MYFVLFFVYRCCILHVQFFIPFSRFLELGSPHLNSVEPGVIYYIYIWLIYGAPRASKILKIPILTGEKKEKLPITVIKKKLD